MKNFLHINKNKILKSIFVSLLIPMTFVFTGLTIFYTNVMEMPGTFSALFPFLLVITAGISFLLFGFQMCFLWCKKDIFFRIVNSVLLAVGIIMWIQGNIFVWNFGRLDGQPVNWSEFHNKANLEIIVFVIIISLFLICNKWVSKYVLHFCIILCCAQSVQIVSEMMRVASFERSTLKSETKHVYVENKIEHKDSNKNLNKGSEDDEILTPEYIVSDSQSYSNIINDTTLEGNVTFEETYFANNLINFDNIFEFSSEKNVLIIILDALSQNVFEDLIHKYPEINKIFKDFTLFTQAISDRPGTVHNISQILTGYDSEKIVTVRQKNHKDIRVDLEHYAVQKLNLFCTPDTIFSKLNNNGYRSDLYTWAPANFYYHKNWFSNVRNKKDNNEENIVRSTSGWVSFTLDSGIFDFLDMATLRTCPTYFKPLVYTRLGDLKDWFYAKYTGDVGFRPLEPTFDDMVFYKALQHNPVSNSNSLKSLKIFHLQGSHPPYKIDDRIKTSKFSNLDKQTIGSLRIIKSLFDQLKKKKCYNNSLIIVMADHGNCYSLYEENFDQENFTRPIMMVKRENEVQNTLIVDHDSYVHIKDITPFVFTELGYVEDGKHFSLFDIPSDLNEKRKKHWERIWTDSKRNLISKNPERIIFNKFRNNFSYSAGLQLLYFDLILSNDSDPELVLALKYTNSADKKLMENGISLGLFADNNSKPEYIAKVEKIIFQKKPVYRFDKKLDWGQIHVVCDLKNITAGTYDIAAIIPVNDSERYKLTKLKKITISNKKISLAE
jgi:hypothetical protein